MPSLQKERPLPEKIGKQWNGWERYKFRDDVLEEDGFTYRQTQGGQLVVLQDAQGNWVGSTLPQGGPCWNNMTQQIDLQRAQDARDDIEEFGALSRSDLRGMSDFKLRRVSRSRVRKKSIRSAAKKELRRRKTDKRWKSKIQSEKSRETTALRELSECKSSMGANPVLDQMVEQMGFLAWGKPSLDATTQAFMRENGLMYVNRLTIDLYSDTDLSKHPFNRGVLGPGSSAINTLVNTLMHPLSSRGGRRRPAPKISFGPNSIKLDKRLTKQLKKGQFGWQPSTGRGVIADARRDRRSKRATNEFLQQEGLTHAHVFSVEIFSNEELDVPGLQRQGALETAANALANHLQSGIFPAGKRAPKIYYANPELKSNRRLERQIERAREMPELRSQRTYQFGSASDYYGRSRPLAYDRLARRYSRLVKKRSAIYERGRKGGNAGELRVRLRITDRRLKSIEKRLNNLWANLSSNQQSTRETARTMSGKYILGACVGGSCPTIAMQNRSGSANHNDGSMARHLGLQYDWYEELY